MRNGFTFNGCHSSELQTTVKTKSRPICPSAKIFTVDMPCCDGVYDFSKANESGRLMYNDRIITVSLGIYADNIFDMQKKLTKISRMLTGEGDLIFDDMPLIVWQGKISDEVIYMPEHGASSALAEVSFRVKPFGQCIFGTEGPLLDVPLITLGENIPIGIEDIMTFSVSGNGSIKVINFGDRPIRPIIRLSDAAEGVKLSLNDKYLSFTSSGETEVDFKKQLVTNSSGTVNVSGKFFELLPGDNEIGVENSNTSDLEIEVEYIPEFTYDAYFDDIQWG